MPAVARSAKEGLRRAKPAFVLRELFAFLTCGILAHGFARVHCSGCGKDALVASCKGRGFCPSCGGRRMADTAAHLVDHVLPHVPVRQWVLTVPFELRYRMAYDRTELREVRRVFLRTIFAHLRRRARWPGHRLPTEFEWEIACARGASGARSTGGQFADTLTRDGHALHPTGGDDTDASMAAPARACSSAVRRRHESLDPVPPRR